MTFEEKLKWLCDGANPRWNKEDYIFYLVLGTTELKAPQLQEIFKIAEEKGTATDGR